MRIWMGLGKRWRIGSFIRGFRSAVFELRSLLMLLLRSAALPRREPPSRGINEDGRELFNCIFELTTTFASYPALIHYFKESSTRKLTDRKTETLNLVLVTTLISLKRQWVGSGRLPDMDFASQTCIVESLFTIGQTRIGAIWSWLASPHVPESWIAFSHLLSCLARRRPTLSSAARSEATRRTSSNLAPDKETGYLVLIPKL